MGYFGAPANNESCVSILIFIVAGFMCHIEFLKRTIPPTRLVWCLPYFLHSGIEVLQGCIKRGMCHKNFKKAI